MKTIVTLGVALLTLASGLYASETERKTKVQEEFFTAICTVYAKHEPTNEQLEHIQSLINAKADLNTKSSGGLNPLFLAAGSPAVMELLLTHNADVNYVSIVCGRNWGSALNWTCGIVRDATSREKCIHTLLNHGADTNIQEENGYTPLHALIQKDTATPDAVELLLAHGAKPNVANREKVTPLNCLDSILASEPLITLNGNTPTFKIPACKALITLKKHRDTLDTLDGSLPMFSLDVVGIVADYFCGKHGVDRAQLKALYEKYTELIQDLRKRGELS